MTPEHPPANDRDWHAAGSDWVEMPRPTVAPLVLSLGITLAAVGVATNLAFLAVGLVLFVVALGMWIG